MKLSSSSYQGTIHIPDDYSDHIERYIRIQIKQMLGIDIGSTADIDWQNIQHRKVQFKVRVN